MSEEDLADQVASASDTALLEDVLEMLLNGVGRDEERLDDGSGGVAVQHETGHFLLPVSQPVCRHEQWRDASGMGWFDDDRDLRPLMGVCVWREALRGRQSIGLTASGGAPLQVRQHGHDPTRTPHLTGRPPNRRRLSQPKQRFPLCPSRELRRSPRAGPVPPRTTRAG